MIATRMYPKAHQNRLHGSHPSNKAPRRKLVKGAIKNLLLLQLLFLSLFAYIFGSLFQQNGHIHNFNVLFVDYDGGVIGEAVRTSYDSLKGSDFLSLQEESPAVFPSIGRLEKEVCGTRYWAALYTTAGASDRLSKALSSINAVTTYKPEEVLTFIWNEARYSAIVDTAIHNNLQNLSDNARLAYTSMNGSFAISAIAVGNKANINILAKPWTLTSLNIQPTSQGSRLIYNTLVIILILIQEFFYLGTVNGLYASLKIYNRIYPHRIITYRNFISLTYTFIGSLCVTGMIWAFRGHWDVNTAQFFLTWVALWLFAHANFLTMDVFTIWLPLPYVPMALITWVVFNVASILVPFELSPGFYRWAYALPAHEIYQILTDIWSRGCNPQLYHALPVLFALELFSFLLSALGVYRRCHYAVIAQEAEDEAFDDRVKSALVFERNRDAEREQELIEEAEGTSNETMLQKAKTKERADVERAIRENDTKMRKELSKSGRSCNFGPSFDLPFKDDSMESMK